MDEFAALTREELMLVLRDVLQVNAEQQARIRRLEEEVARLRGGGPPPSASKEPPSFVKPNRRARDESASKPPRKRRPHGFARARQTPTRTVEHFPSSCSQCGRSLAGGWLHASRQVIEVPFAPVEVIEHRFMARHCGVCNRREIARGDLSGQVVGQSRLGIRLMSVIGYLDTVCRMPLASIQSLLSGLYGLCVSQGEIVRVLHTLSHRGKQAYQALLSEIRKSSVVHVDETGAREDGQNGQVWSLSTPQIRFYHRDPSRSSAVIQELLGYDPRVYGARTAREVREAHQARRRRSPDEPAPFAGKLVSDFYSGYHWYPGWHQYCLVHLDRDLDELKAKNSEDPEVCAWVTKALKLMERAKDYARAQNEQPIDTGPQRRRKRFSFEQEAEELARPYCRSALPQHTLAERIYKHRYQLFVFVEHPEVPSDNNAAERAIRPFVVMRKISGGTRSARGSHTQAVLLSLFSTWRLRGQDPLAACQDMLSGVPACAPA